MPGGRPTTYDPAFCEEAIEFMSRGYSVGALAGHLRVARSTVYLWAETHHEFSDALEVGKSLSQLFWEGRNIEIAKSGDGNATATIFALKNRARDDWRDRQEVEQSGEVKHDHNLNVSGADKLKEFLGGIASRTSGDTPSE